MSSHDDKQRSATPRTDELAAYWLNTAPKAWVDLAHDLEDKLARAGELHDMAAASDRGDAVNGANSYTVTELVARLRALAEHHTPHVLSLSSDSPWRQVCRQAADILERSDATDRSAK